MKFSPIIGVVAAVLVTGAIAQQAATVQPVAEVAPAPIVALVEDKPATAGDVTRGQTKSGTCAACHGADGKGNTALGAPNLSDKVWLHGWGEQAIIGMITAGKTNTMPAQGRLLTPEQVHVLAGYVLSLSQAQRVAGN